jgi:hypothetical protein
VLFDLSEIAADVSSVDLAFVDVLSVDLVLVDTLLFDCVPVVSCEPDAAALSLSSFGLRLIGNSSEILKRLLLWGHAEQLWRERRGCRGES